MRRIEPGHKVPRTIALYGPPKIAGKSRLAATAMRGAPEIFGEKAIYIAADPGSEALDSILVEDRERMYTYTPSPEKGDPPWVIGGNYNPNKEAIRVATARWRELHPDVTTLIYDTMTKTSADILQWVAVCKIAPADSQAGRPEVGQKGKADNIVSPSRSDIGFTQPLMLQLLRHLFDTGLNIICLFHEKGHIPDGATSGQGGPMTIGNKQSAAIAGAFQHCVRLSVTSKKVKGVVEQTRMARTGPHSSMGIQWLAGVRSGDPMPMPDQVLDPDPVEFWRTFAKTVGDE